MRSKRSLHTSDAEALASLHARCFGDEAWTATQMEGSLLLATTRACGWWDDDCLVAFYLVQCVAEDVEILTLCVDPANRRQGLGRVLVEAILALTSLQKAGSVFLDVAEDNVAARALYESCGFHPIGHRPNYYHRKGALVDAVNYRYTEKRINGT